MLPGVDLNGFSMLDLSSHQKLLIFGGTFDPPHVGHVTQAERVRQQLGFDVVVYLPTGRSPHKQGHQQTDAAIRLSMVRAAVADQPHAVVSDIELRRPTPSYTVDTLEALSQGLAPGASMRLLIGADQARVFDKWFQAERIAEWAEPVVMVRPPDTVAGLQDALPEVWRDRLVSIPEIDLSATEIRDRVRVKKSIQGLVPPGVAQIIQEQKLYIDPAP